MIVRDALSVALAMATLASVDAPLTPRSGKRAESAEDRTAASDAVPGGDHHDGDERDGSATAPADGVLFYELRAGAFPGSARPDVAVHVPPGFDSALRPGLVVYFHGWNGCVSAALSADDEPCTDGGSPRTGTDLASAIDDARVNALLVAVELRSDMPTGEPGKLALPAGFRDLLRELFTEHLAGPLGRELAVDSLDRVEVVAHSGGYQAAASALALGDVPRITEVDLLDGLYGADEVFFDWIEAQAPRFDPRVNDPLRFVDLYTCCAGTNDESRMLANRVRGTLGSTGLGGAFSDDDGDSPIDATALAHGVVFKRVSETHPALPRAYFRRLIEAAGFAHIESHPAHSLRPK